MWGSRRLFDGSFELMELLSDWGEQLLILNLFRRCQSEAEVEREPKIEN